MLHFTVDCNLSHFCSNPFDFKFRNGIRPLKYWEDWEKLSFVSLQMQLDFSSMSNFCFKISVAIISFFIRFSRIRKEVHAIIVWKMLPFSRWQSIIRDFCRKICLLVAKCTSPLLDPNFRNPHSKFHILSSVWTRKTGKPKFWRSLLTVLNTPC